MSCSGIRSRALSGMRACNCCASAASKSASRVGQLVLSMLSQALSAAGGIPGGEPSPDLWIEPRASESLVLEASGRVAGVLTADPVIVGVPAGAVGTLGVGAAVVFQGALADYLAQEQAAQTLVSELSNAIPPIVAVARRYAEGECELCVRRSLWSQSSPRYYTTELRQKRV